MRWTTSTWGENGLEPRLFTSREWRTDYGLLRCRPSAVPTLDKLETQPVVTVHWWGLKLLRGMAVATLVLAVMPTHTVIAEVGSNAASRLILVRDGSTVRAPGRAEEVWLVHLPAA